MLCVTDNWGVTYNHPSMCTIKGSTVKISCTYTYPSSYQFRTHSYYDRHDYPPFDRYYWDRGYGRLPSYETVKANVINSFWFTKWPPMDLYQDPQYAGRVGYHCVTQRSSCTLTIRNLTDADSTDYMFRFITNIRNVGKGKFAGPPVKLVVTGNLVLLFGHDATWRYFIYCRFSFSFLFYGTLQVCR